MKKFDKSLTHFGDALCKSRIFLHVKCLHVVVQLYNGVTSPCPQDWLDGWTTLVSSNNDHLSLTIIQIHHLHLYITFICVSHSSMQTTQLHPKSTISSLTELLIIQPKLSQVHLNSFIATAKGVTLYI